MSVVSSEVVVSHKDLKTHRLWRERIKLLEIVNWWRLVPNVSTWWVCRHSQKSGFLTWNLCLLPNLLHCSALLCSEQFFHFMHTANYSWRQNHSEKERTYCSRLSCARSQFISTSLLVKTWKLHFISNETLSVWDEPKLLVANASRSNKDICV